MRTLLVVLAVPAAFIAVGFLVVPLIAAHLPNVLGVVGVALLVIGLCMRGRSRCEGLSIHCGGCRHH